MTIALPRAGERAIRSIDLSRPVMVLLALFLCGLVLLPLGWLVWYSVTDNNGALTAANFVRLATDPSFARPYLTALEIAASVALGAAAAALPLAWLVARTDLPLRRLIRALVTASFVTPPFLGAIAWEILAAPNSGILNRFARELFGLGEYEHIVNIYTAYGVVFTMACYSFPYVFVLIANALDNIPADLEDASAILGGGRWHTLRRVTLPMVLPALLAGGLVAFVQTLTQFGVPAILAMPAGFHVITTKIWALVPASAGAALGRGRGDAVARRDHPAAARPATAARAARLYRDRRPIERAATGNARCLALAGPRLRPGIAVAADHPALCGADQDSDRAHPVRSAELGNAELAQCAFRLCRVLADPERAVEHRSARPAVGNGRYRAGAGRRLCHEPTAVRRTPFSRLAGDRAGRDPRHRARGRAVLQLHAPADRALRHAVDTAAGLSDDRIAGRLSADPGGLSRPSSRAGGGEPDLRRQPAEISLATSPRRCCARAWWRPGASCLSA